jgi:hypothetical protein
MQRRGYWLFKLTYVDLPFDALGLLTPLLMMSHILPLCHDEMCECTNAIFAA